LSIFFLMIAFLTSRIVVVDVAAASSSSIAFKAASVYLMNSARGMGSLA
jgi:hypothetical protein